MANNSVDDTIHKEEKKYAFKDPNFDVSIYIIFQKMNRFNIMFQILTYCLFLNINSKFFS